MRRAIILALLAATAGAAPAGAQYVWTGGHLGGGRGGVESRLLDARFTIAGGYDFRIGDPSGLSLGVRAVGAYSRFDPNVEAYLDSLGASTGSRQGGSATTSESGLDFVAQYRVGPVGVHGFYGVHYYIDTAREMTLNTDQGDYTFHFRYRDDFGDTRGFGVSLHLMNGQGIYGEWYRGGGDAERMRALEGVRFGFFWGW